MYPSPHPDVTIPDLSLHEFVLEEAAARGDRPALVDGPSGRTITHAHLADAVPRVAAGLAARGLGKGEIVALFSPNIPEFALAFFGIAAAGGVATTINSLYTSYEIENQLKDSGARFLITVPPFLDRALPAAQATGIEEVYVLGEADGATPFASLLASGGALPDVSFEPAEDLVVLPYSSGTTGLPKGVMLTHRNLVANVLQTAEAHRFGEDDTLAGVLPFFHAYGMLVILSLGIRQGATVVTMPRFELEPFLAMLQDHGVTVAHVVPPIVLALAKHPAVDSYDLSRLRLVLSGAAPLGEDLQRACADRLGCKVIQGYGMTEASPVTHVVPEEAAKMGSIGPPIPSTDARVVDVATGEDLGPGEDGEILVRGPQVMKGYLNNPVATANTIDDNGWLHSGDIGHADEDGHFYVVDRLKELIKYKAFQVPPAELEAVLHTHPAVGDAAVIGINDEEAGEVPKAFVVLKGDATADELMAYVTERVAPYKRIRAFEFIDEIPKSASGKILRRVLIDRERDR